MAVLSRAINLVRPIATVLDGFHGGQVLEPQVAREGEFIGDARSKWYRGLPHVVALTRTLSHTLHFLGA